MDICWKNQRYILEVFFSLNLIYCYCLCNNVYYFMALFIFRYLYL